MNFRSLVEKIFGEDKELAAAEKWFMEGGTPPKDKEDVCSKKTEKNTRQEETGK